MQIYETVALNGDKKEGTFSCEPKDIKLGIYLAEDGDFQMGNKDYNFIYILKNEEPVCLWFESSNKEYPFEIPVLYTLLLIEKFLY